MLTDTAERSYCYYFWNEWLGDANFNSDLIKN